MRQVLIFSAIILFSISCNKSSDQCDDDPNRMVETFSNATFKRFGEGYHIDDMVLTKQNQVVIAGLNSALIAHTKQPFLSLLDAGLSEVWEETFTLDYSNLHKSVRIVSTSQDNLLLIFNSIPDDLSGYRLEMIEYYTAGFSNRHSTIKEEGANLRPVSIVEIPNGEFVILSSEIDANSPQPEEFYLTRVANDGDQIWTKSIPTESLYIPTYIINSSSNASLFTASEHFIERNNSAEIHIHKLDYEANLDWKKSIVVSGKLWPASSNITAFGNDDMLISFSSRIIGQNVGHIFLIKMDQSGEIEWEKRIKGCGSNVVSRVLPTSDGNIMLLIHTTAFGAGEFDIMLTKMDSAGNVLWEKVYGGLHSDQGNKILEKPNGNFIISGNTNGGTISELVFEGFVFEIDKDGFPL